VSPDGARGTIQRPDLAGFEARARIPIEERWEALFPNLAETTLEEQIEATRARKPPAKARAKTTRK
jgi:hypothetical protein